MEEDIKAWMKKSSSDLKASKDSLNSGNYEWACFQAQQSVEKALKSLYIKKNKRLWKTHDLVLLAKEVKAPEEIILFCSQINPAYIDTRYPSLEVNYVKDDAIKIINLARRILTWTKKNL